MADEHDDDGLDEDEQRLGDLWGMSHAEQEKFVRGTIWLILVAAIAAVVLFSVCSGR